MSDGKRMTMNQAAAQDIFDHLPPQVQKIIQETAITRAKLMDKTRALLVTKKEYRQVFGQLVGLLITQPERSIRIEEPDKIGALDLAEYRILTAKDADGAITLRLFHITEEIPSAFNPRKER